MTEEKQNEQELLFKFSLYERQIRELQQQIEAVEKGIIDLTSLNFGLDELVGAKGKEICAPLGRGIFVDAKVISEELKVDIGGGNIVKKSIPETKELIEDQIRKLEQVKKELENNLDELGKEITKVMNQAQEQESHGHEHNHSHEGHVHDENCRHG